MIKLSGCVIYDKNGRILLIHRSDPNLTEWEIPGGKIEPDESAESTAARELKEELGVSVSHTKEIGGEYFDWDGISYHYAWFESEIVKGSPKVLEPHKFDDMRYFSIDEIKELKIEEASVNVWNLLKELD